MGEITEAADWYHGHAPALGADFRKAVRSALAIIREDPLRFPLVWKAARAAMLSRFPYRITFTADDREVVVVACTHHRRDPDTWMDRVP